MKVFNKKGELLTIDSLIKDLTASIVAQLVNMGVITISATQWGALGVLVEWTAWVPTLTGGADLSGYDIARYYRVGKLCFFQFVATAKNVTTAGQIQITLPFTAANTDYHSPSGQVYDGAAWVGQPMIEVNKNNNYVSVFKTITAGNWAGTENGVNIRISGFFEIA